MFGLVGTAVSSSDDKAQQQLNPATLIDFRTGKKSGKANEG